MVDFPTPVAPITTNLGLGRSSVPRLTASEDQITKNWISNKLPNMSEVEVVMKMTDDVSYVLFSK